MDVLDAQFVAGADSVPGLPAPAFAEVAFAGRSNVGKSSLINNLVQRNKLVRTSSTPGCTRGINIFRVRFRGGAEMDLVDLPGYGYAKRSKKERKSWGPLIETFLEVRPGLRAVVLIVDVRRGLQEDDVQLLEYLEHLGHPAIVVATKLDKLAPNKRKPALSKVQKSTKHRVLGYSATESLGRKDLWHLILKRSAISLSTPVPRPRST